MKTSEICTNDAVQLFYRKTAPPILNALNWCARHVGLSIFLLLVIGMALRIGYRGMIDRMERDEIVYIQLSETISSANGNSSGQYLPLLIHVGTLLNQLGINVESGLRCFNFFCSFLWLVCMYLLGKIVFNSCRVGLLCLALTVFNPYTIRLAGQIMREPLYLLFFTGVMLCAVKIVRGDNIVPYSALAGILTTAGIWSRHEGCELLFIIPLACGFHYVWAKRSARLPQRRQLVFGIVCYLLCLGIAGTALLIYQPRLIIRWQQKFNVSYNKIFTAK